MIDVYCVQVYMYASQSITLGSQFFPSTFGCRNWTQRLARQVLLLTEPSACSSTPAPFLIWLPLRILSHFSLDFQWSVPITIFCLCGAFVPGLEHLCNHGISYIFFYISLNPIHFSWLPAPLTFSLFLYELNVLLSLYL